MRTHRQSAGFTWIELTIVIAVIGILAAMTIPGMQENMLKRQVKEGMQLADVAKAGIAKTWAVAGKMPMNNAEAGVPAKEKIVGSLVKEVSVENGAINVVFGNNASKVLEGKKLTIRPAVVKDEPSVPVAWLCNDVPVPNGMEIRGANQTEIEKKYLPLECRDTTKK